MNNRLLKNLKELKKSLKEIEIIGFIGSQAKNIENEDSDIDLVIRVKEEFKVKYKGFKYFEKLEEIKESIQNFLKKDIDLINIEATNKIMQNVIKRDLVNV